MLRPDVETAAKKLQGPRSGDGGRRLPTRHREEEGQNTAERRQGTKLATSQPRQQGGDKEDKSQGEEGVGGMEEETRCLQPICQRVIGLPLMFYILFPLRNGLNKTVMSIDPFDSIQVFLIHE